MDKQGNVMVWTLPERREIPDYALLVLNDNNTFTLRVDKYKLNENNTGQIHVVLNVTDNY